MKQTKAEMAYIIKLLESKVYRMQEMLEWFRDCKCEALDTEGDKWKAELINEIAIVPVNRKAKLFLAEINWQSPPA